MIQSSSSAAIQKSEKNYKKKGEIAYHDFTNGGGRDTIAIFRLLEFLDGDGFSAVGGGLDPSEEDETVGSFSDLPNQIVLLKPLWFVAVGAVAVSHGCSSFTSFRSRAGRNHESETEEFELDEPIG